MRETGLGLKAATITPEGADDVGSPEPDPARGDRRQGDHAHRPADPGRDPGRRRPPPDLGLPDGGRRRLRRRAVARGRRRRRELANRTETIRRSDCRAVAEYAFREAERIGGRVYGGPKWTVSPVYEGMLKEEMDAAAERHPEVGYEPVLIDATLAGLVTGAATEPLVIPCLNRDGDLLSDLVLPLFGSIAGAESVLLALDADLARTVAMAEAPHGTAPALEGKDIANPMAMILAAAALLHYARRPEPSNGVAGGLRVGARDGRRRHPHPRSRRPRGDDGVHRRRDRAGPAQARGLVLAVAAGPCRAHRRVLNTMRAGMEAGMVAAEPEGSPLERLREAGRNHPALADPRRRRPVRRRSCA